MKSFSVLLPAVFSLLTVAGIGGCAAFTGDGQQSVSTYVQHDEVPPPGNVKPTRWRQVQETVRPEATQIEDSLNSRFAQ